MKTILYLGTDPTHFSEKAHVIHCPIIKIIPKTEWDEDFLAAWQDFSQYTHILFTSKNAVSLFFAIGREILQKEVRQEGKMIISIGKSTSYALKERGWSCIEVEDCTQEGMAQRIEKESKDSYFFYPRSIQARPYLRDFLEKKGFKYQVCDLYDTVTNPESALFLKDLVSKADEIYFTSPSTVKSFFEICGSIPQGKRAVCIGRITEDSLQKMVKLGN